MDRRLAVSRSGQTELDGVEDEVEVDAVVAEPRVDVAAPDECEDRGVRVAIDKKNLPAERSTTEKTSG